ncbi:MAG: isopenicillin synthase family oxygenase [Rhodospirillales bacterium]|nr:isopenicillin synthase family oxygenase [Rhodospirillales bacterium]
MARIFPISALPLIDLGGLRSSDRAKRDSVADQIGLACCDKGFFYIENHGVPQSLIEAVFRESRNFFALPVAEQLEVGRDRSFCNRGFEPLGGQDLEQTGVPDVKEAFDLGAELAEDDPRVVARKVNHGPNQWPSGLPTFRRVMEGYFDVMLELTMRLMGAVATSLGLAEDHFASFCTEPVALLRLLHYPTQPAKPHPREKGCGAHTDWGALTVLLQDDAAGLQIKDPVHGWLHAPPRPGSFVVNLGDLIARWTNDRYHSTQHRVINVSGRARFFVPFFLDGNPDHLISCLPGCSTPDNPARYRPVTVAEHTNEMHRLTMVGGPRERR